MDLDLWPRKLPTNGKEIKVSELCTDTTDAVSQALRAYCTEVGRLHKQAVERAIDDQLLEEAAKAEGKDLDGYVREQIESKVKPPSDKEIQAYYDKVKSADAPPLQQIRAQVEQTIMQEKSREVYVALVGNLRGKAQIQIQLPDIRPPALDVDIPEHTPTFGPDAAKVTVVEFSDFECPYCAKAAAMVATVKRRFDKDVRFGFRHFPLSFHPNARPAAELAQCANEQGKFWHMHDEIFANSAELSGDKLRNLAKTSGLKMAALDDCLQSGRAREAVASDLAKGSAVGVKGTPSFFINGRPYDGPLSPSGLADAIQAELDAV